MYCSSCGGNVTPGLSYCNHCGAKLSAANDAGKTSEIPAQTLIGAMVVTFMFGLAALVALVGATKKFDFYEPVAFLLIGLVFLLLITLEAIFVWLLLSRRKNEQETRRINQAIAQETTRELYQTPAARVLVEPVPSVIEQTTNQLEPILRDRKSG